MSPVHQQCKIALCTALMGWSLHRAQWTKRIFDAFSIVKAKVNQKTQSLPKKGCLKNWELFSCHRVISQSWIFYSSAEWPTALNTAISLALHTHTNRLKTDRHSKLQTHRPAWAVGVDGAYTHSSLLFPLHTCSPWLDGQWEFTTFTLSQTHTVCTQSE